MAQVAIGLVNGAFYAMLSLGLAVIFGMLNVINFTHGAQFMMGAFAAWLLLGILDVPFWASLVLAPLIVGLFGVVIERLLLKRIYHLDHRRHRLGLHGHADLPSFCRGGGARDLSRDLVRHRTHQARRLPARGDR